jgi:hypothetical protein
MAIIAANNNGAKVCRSFTPDTGRYRRRDVADHSFGDVVNDLRDSGNCICYDLEWPTNSDITQTNNQFALIFK